ncbi:MAG: hypothetical protein IJ530_07020 [Treponema sp.]|uniref:hypothetical protein n=1 Tax=Treponema sp. TaxID=166 RepID=UPI0025DAFFE8|nr:hypothetical protein [Treponema sp.]MBQ8679499.1 hypothetical protein [Treponema sp.]
MANKTTIICKKCGEKYFITEENYPMRDKGRLTCEKCGYVLKVWNCGAVYSLEKSSDEDK